MNTDLTIAGDGVPLHLSNPQSAALVAAQTELDDAHDLLTRRGIPRRRVDGSPISVRLRILLLQLRTERPLAPPISMHAELPIPFADDDPMLPIGSPQMTGLGAALGAFTVVLLVLFTGFVVLRLVS